MIRERFNAMGDWSLELGEGTPLDKRDLVPFTWFIVTNGKIDPSTIGRDEILAQSIYTGVCLTRKKRLDGSVVYSGHGLRWLLGDGRGKGPSRNAVTGSDAPTDFADIWNTGTSGLALFSTAGRVNGLTPGAATSFNIAWLAFIIYTAYPTFEGLRKELGEESTLFPLDLYVHPDGTADCAERTDDCWFRDGDSHNWPLVADLPEPGQARASGDIVARVWKPTKLEVTESWEDWASSGSFSYNNYGSTARADRTHSYKDFGGSDPLYFDACGNDQSETDSDVASGRAQDLLADNDATLEIDLEVKPTLTMLAEAHVGQFLWIYAPELGLIDHSVNSDQIIGGQVMRPVQYRLLGLDFPNIEGLGYYLADNDWNIYDLTPHVLTETGDARVDVGERVAKRNLLAAIGGTGRQLGWS